MKILVPIPFLGMFALAYSVIRGYQPLSPGSTLLVLAAVCIVALGILAGAPKDEPVCATYVVLALVPWLFAGFFIANGSLDRAPEIRYQTVVIGEHYSQRFPGDEVIVRSWRAGRTTESVYVRGYQPFFLPGRSISLGIKPGALGVPWVSSVSR